MKKIFTLIAAALMVVGASAQTYKSDFTDQQTFDATTANVDAAVTAGWMAHNGTENGNQNPGITLDTEEVTTSGLTSATYYKIKKKGTRDITVYITGVSKLKVFVKNGSAEARNLYASVNDGAEQTLASPNNTSAVGEVSLEKDENNKVVLYASGDIYLVGLKFTTADDLTPSLSTNTSEISLAATPYQTSQSAEFTLSGKNLTPGTYNLTVPNLAGLSVEPTSFTVDSEGKVNQEFTVTYTSTEDVAEATANITATVNGKTATIAVNYVSRATLDEQVEVSTATTWDWSGMTDEVELTEETNPKRSDNPVMSNLTHLFDIPASFNAQAIQLIDTQFPVRGGCMQNGTASFRTTGTGVVTVTFSDTGSGASATAPERYLCINGVKQNIYTKRDGSVDKKTSEPIEVAAGKVTISGVDADGSTPQAIRIYTITFTPQDVTNPIPAATDDEPSDPTGINTVATDAAKANVVKKYVDGKQVVIEKNGKKYNVAGAQIK